MKRISVRIPSYTHEQEIDFKDIGAILDQLFVVEFPNQWLAVRGISIDDHPDRNPVWLMDTIQANGTDRYDPNRQGVHTALDKEFSIDLHAIPMIAEKEIFCPHYSGDRCETGSPFGDFLRDCYDGAKIDRGYALRIDIFMLYDLDQLQAAPLLWTDDGPTLASDPIPPLESSTFQFKDSSAKQQALVGLIHIDR